VTRFLGERGERRLERVASDRFSPDAARKTVKSHFSRLNPSSSPTTKPPAAAKGEARGFKEEEEEAGAGEDALASLPRECVCALGPLVEHLTSFGLVRVLARPRLRPFASAVFMLVDGVTLRDLEVFASQPDGKEQGSLFHLLDRTRTPFGSRRLRDWVRRPLLRVDDVHARLEAVEELAQAFPMALEPLADRLKRVHDLELSISLLHYRRLSPKRLVSLLEAVREVLGELPPPEALTPEHIRSELLREEMGGVPRGLDKAVGRLLGLIDRDAAEKDDKPNLLTDPDFFPKLTSKKDALKDVDAGLQVRAWGGKGGGQRRQGALL
jgi:DNA mismatch repair protein MSH3